MKSYTTTSFADSLLYQDILGKNKEMHYLMDPNNHDMVDDDYLLLELECKYLKKKAILNNMLIHSRHKIY
jgi:hypothetical protein